MFLTFIVNKLKILKIVIAILIVLAGFRLALPYVILQYVEYQINRIPEYRVEIKDLDIHLYRGSYTIKNIKLLRVNKSIPVPFFSADAINLSVEWRALLHGSVVGQIQFKHPALNFVVDPRGENQQLTIDEEWRKAVSALFPLNFNKISVQDGVLHYRSFTTKPPFDIYLKNINAEVKNLRNATGSKKTLPASLVLKANSMDGATCNIDINFDPLATQPTFDMDAALEDMSIRDANNFLQHYTKVRVNHGRFSLYVEAVAKQGKVKGYAKPIFQDLDVAKPKQDASIGEVLSRGAAKLTA